MHLTPLQTLDLETIVSIVVFALVVYAVIRLEALHRRVSVLPKPVAAVKPAPAPKPPPKPNPIAVVVQHIEAGISAGIAAAKAPVAKSTEPAWPPYDAPAPAAPVVTVVAAIGKLEPLVVPDDFNQFTAMKQAITSSGSSADLKNALRTVMITDTQSATNEYDRVVQPEPTHVEVPIDPAPVASVAVTPPPAAAPVAPVPEPIVVSLPAPAPEHIVLTPASENAPNLQPGVTAEAAAAFEAQMEARNAPPPAPARVILNADGKPIA